MYNIKSWGNAIKGAEQSRAGIAGRELMIWCATGSCPAVACVFLEIAQRGVLKELLAPHKAI